MANSKLKWKRHDVAEELLDAMGVDHSKLVLVPMGSIDVDSSRHNMARKKPITEETAQDYALMMRNGDAFPAIVLVHGEKGFVIVSGNHRCAAAEMAGEELILAYIVDLDNTQFAAFAVGINRKEGMRGDKSEAIEHAVDLVQNHGCSTEYAAKCCGVHPSSVTGQIRVVQSQVRLRSAGIHGADGLSKTSLQTIARLLDDDMLLRPAVDLARALPTAELAGAVSKVANTPGTAAKKALATEIARNALSSNNRSKKDKKKLSYSRSTVVLRSLSTIEAQLDEEKAWPLNREQSIEVHNRLKSLLSILVSYLDN